MLVGDQALHLLSRTRQYANRYRFRHTIFLLNAPKESCPRQVIPEIEYSQSHARSGALRITQQTDGHSGCTLPPHFCAVYFCVLSSWLNQVWVAYLRAIGLALKTWTIAIGSCSTSNLSNHAVLRALFTEESQGTLQNVESSARHVTWQNPQKPFPATWEKTSRGKLI
jgi:hypothetical protein